LTAVKQALCREWPVCGGFRWPKNPVKWKDDILETPPSDGVIDGHSVLLVGYRDDPEQPGGGVFLFRNTNNGGREGWMTYEYACTYMNDALWIDYETEEAKIILTPKAGPEPRINGPGVFGCRPGRPFVYRIPCTGVRPLAFSADGLPSGLRLDTQTGILTGSVPDKPGRYEISLSASNASGKSSRDLTLVVGDTLALTPPMGWNSWYIHYADVTEQHMRKAADTMIDSGMADYGYMYVNIDDCWMKKRGDEPYRDEKGSILTNDKFPDIRGMCDYIHAKGLRAGIYTSPGPWTCAGYVGSYGHEESDIKTFAEWGFDFLKYDLCSYEQQIYAEKVKETNNSLLEYQRPYRLMGELLKQAHRDMVYNLCQYGRAEVWKWAGDVEGNCWRTTEDLGHFIEGLSGFYGIGFSNMEHVEYAGPGRWNDPDYLIIGWVGDSSAPGGSRPTALTPNEQYSYMSMWCLMASPLFFSGDMSRLDDFTLNVLCNAEVIEVDQDVLGDRPR
jgi:alpha-galactosidase